MFLRAIWPPLDTPLCGAGAERVRKLNERERGVKKYGWRSGAGRSRSGSWAVSKGYRKRRERKFRPLPLRSHALSGLILNVELFRVSVNNSTFSMSQGILCFDQHIVDVCKACYFHIQARESLPDDVAATIACSIISSRLDYCIQLSVHWDVGCQFCQAATCPEHTRTSVATPF